jgi:hypothetical protein
MSGICSCRWTNERSAFSQSESSQCIWTVARCQRILRTIESKIVLLRRTITSSSIPQTHANCSLSAQNPSRLKRFTGGQPVAPVLVLPATSGQSQRIKTTYCKRSRVKHALRKVDYNNDSIPCPFRVQSLGISSQVDLRNQPGTTSDLGNGSIAIASTKHSVSGIWALLKSDSRSQEVICRLRMHSPHIWPIMEGLCNSIHSVFTSVLDNGSQPQIGARSLVDLCLRKIPQLVQNDENAIMKDANLSWNEREALKATVMPSMYKEIKEAGMFGCSSFRAILRSRCRLYIRRAIVENLVSDDLAFLLVKICLIHRAQDEARDITHEVLARQHVLPLPSGPKSRLLGTSSPICLELLGLFYQQSAHRTFFHRELSRLYKDRRLSYKWLETVDMSRILADTMISLATGDSLAKEGAIFGLDLVRGGFANGDEEVFRFAINLCSLSVWKNILTETRRQDDMSLSFLISCLSRHIWNMVTYDPDSEQILNKVCPTYMAVLLAHITRLRRNEILQRGDIHVFRDITRHLAIGLNLSSKVGAVPCKFESSGNSIKALSNVFLTIAKSCSVSLDLGAVFNTLKLILTETSLFLCRNDLSDMMFPGSKHILGRVSLQAAFAFANMTRSSTHLEWSETFEAQIVSNGIFKDIASNGVSMASATSPKPSSYLCWEEGINEWMAISPVKAAALSIVTRQITSRAFGKDRNQSSNGHLFLPLFLGKSEPRTSDIDFRVTFDKGARIPLRKDIPLHQSGLQSQTQLQEMSLNSLGIVNSKTCFENKRRRLNPVPSNVSKATFRNHRRQVTELFSDTEDELSVLDGTSGDIPSTISENNSLVQKARISVKLTNNRANVLKDFSPIRLKA